MEAQLNLLKQKIFDIMHAKLNGEKDLNTVYAIMKNPEIQQLHPEQFLAALPHAAEALKIIDTLKLDKTPPLYIDPIKNCARHFFKKKHAGS
jgi:hypothetical protein